MKINQNSKRKYTKPTFTTVVLQGCRSMILCGSADATMDITYEEEDI